MAEIPRGRPPQLETYERTLHAVNLMRRFELSLTAAAQEAGTTPKTVLRYARSALKRRGGEWTARPRDRLERRMRFYDPRGSLFVTVPASSASSRISDYHHAIRRFVEEGDDSGLREFRGKFVVDVEGGRQYFLSDPAVIRRLQHAGEFQFESIY